MATNTSGGKAPPAPWGAFLAELDALLTEPVELHCIGGFAIAACYGLPRPTGDLDYISVRPNTASANLLQIAGEGSPLHKKHKLYLQQVGVVNYPESYEDRLIRMYPDRFGHLRILALDPYDLALTKLERNLEVDREDVAYLAKAAPLDYTILEQRYRQELRPNIANVERHDLTLQLWRDAYFPDPPKF